MRKEAGIAIQKTAGPLSLKFWNYLPNHPE
jgi:hypothetical protein